MAGIFVVSLHIGFKVELFAVISVMYKDHFLKCLRMVVYVKISRGIYNTAVFLFCLDIIIKKPPFWKSRL